MSGSPMDTKLGNVPRDDGPPRHRVHNANDPLPGSRVDRQPADKGLFQEEVAKDHNASNEERPLDVHPTQAGRCSRCPFSKSVTDAKLSLRN